MSDLDGIDADFAAADRRIAELEAMNQRLRSLVPFVNDVITAIFEGCGFDGCDLQEMLAQRGVLHEETMT